VQKPTWINSMNWKMNKKSPPKGGLLYLLL